MNGDLAPPLFRVVIVEDEPLGRRLVRSLLRYDEQLELVGEAQSVASARELIESYRPDLVFLDIELPDGTGTDLLATLPEPRPYVIFVTAHAHYAARAFELHAVDYLLKPVQKSRFAECLLRAKRVMSEERLWKLTEQISGLAAYYVRQQGEPAARFPARLDFRQRNRLVSLLVDDIEWIESANQYSKVHSSRGEFLLSKTLAAASRDFDPARFCRIHRSALVNITKVRQVRIGEGNKAFALMSSGVELPIARARRTALNALLDQLSRR